MTNAAACCLCSQIEGHPSHDLIAGMLPDRPYVRRVMLETPVFAMLPSLGPLVPGHSLLCPKTHIRSFARLDRCAYDEFQGLKRTLRPVFERLYGTGVHLFEHGMAAAGNRILCTVDHAHMHFVPLPRTARMQVVEQAGWIGFDGSLDGLRRLSRDSEYIFYEAPDGAARLLLPAGGELESQYMRKLLAQALDRAGRWNWREDPDAPAADETWRAFTESRI